MGGIVIKNRTKVKLDSIEDVESFCLTCSKFDQFHIDYKIDTQIINAKSLLGILSTTLGEVAEIVVHSENNRAIDSFLDAIEKWTV